MKRKIIIFLGLFFICDLIIWGLTYRVATAPSAETLRLAEAVTPTLPPSSVNADQIAPVQRISLHGPWRYRQTGREIVPYIVPKLDTQAWPTMDLPQNWYLAGLNYHGVIWFQRQFRAESSWAGRVVRLHFDGVDYLADVWLNGHHLGQHEGYFQPFDYAIHELLNFNGENTLLVRVESPYEDVETTWPERKTVIKGIFNHHPTRPGGETKATGQALNTGGIWNEVYLSIENAVTIASLQLQAHWDVSETDQNTATLLVRGQLTNAADERLEAEAQLTLTPHNFSGKAFTLPTQRLSLPRGQTVFTLTGRIIEPQRWTAWDRGQAALYTAHLVLKPTTTSASDKATFAETEVAFGFREFQQAHNGTWLLNGQRFFLRGTHYISSQWLSQVDRAWLKRDLRLLREANINTIWVYAHVAPPAFYELADEMGFLVWQDFPLYGGYSDTPAFVDQAQAQFTDMIGQLTNHPSVVLWNVHQSPPWAAATSKVPSERNRKLDQRLHHLAEALDPTRVTLSLAPSNGGPVETGWAADNWRALGQQETPALITAYGAQALPDLKALTQFIPTDSPPYPASDLRARWRFHGFQPKETAQITEVVMEDSLAAFVDSSQAYQAHLLQYATETFRRRKYSARTGLFQFMFVDHWPAISHAVVDYERRPKAGFFALRTAMQPILPSIVPSLPQRLAGRRWVYEKAADLSLAFWILNDTRQSYSRAKLTWTITDEQGQLVLHGARSGQVPLDAVHRWYQLQPTSLSTGVYRLSLVLSDEAGKVLGENSFEFIIERNVK